MGFRLYGFAVFPPRSSACSVVKRVYYLCLPAIPESRPSPPLARKLGLFDATMLVMGGTIGGGIFVNSYVVAQRVHTPALVLGAWVAGGVIALTGALIYAEIASRLPRVGGQYAYLREAYHPLLAFLYGWVLLLVIQTAAWPW